MFEYDPAKSAANFAKHGIDFEAVQALWLDDRRLTVALDFPGEERRIVIGGIDDRLWAAIITVRGEAIRIISVRRARKQEEALYGPRED